MSGEYVLTLSCPDRRGIVAAVANALADRGGNIVDSQQFGDASTGLFFMRVHVAVDDPASGEVASAAVADPAAGPGAAGDQTSYDVPGSGAGASGPAADQTSYDALGVAGSSVSTKPSEPSRASDSPGSSASYRELHAALEPVAERFGMDWGLFDTAVRPRMLVLVSRFGHCLNDLLFRQRTGALAVDIPAVVSNHEEFRELVESYGIPFHHLPVTAETKPDQEKAILALAAEHDVDLVVLARYMQVLSPDMCAALEGRAINIHHSFLPSFKGAAPYQQAFARGVKLIGATAHYVTANLDEGPIIEQEVARVDHAMGPRQLSAVGRDLECVALARAVQWHLEHRVLLNGSKTVVFR